MANSFRPRSWKLRADAAKYRKARNANMTDIRAVRAALVHGEPVPEDALARINGTAAPEAPAPEAAPVVEAEAEEAKKPARAPRKA